MRKVSKFQESVEGEKDCQNEFAISEFTVAHRGKTEPANIGIPEI